MKNTVDELNNLIWQEYQKMVEETNNAFRWRGQLLVSDKAPDWTNESEPTLNSIGHHETYYGHTMGEEVIEFKGPIQYASLAIAYGAAVGVADSGDNDGYIPALFRILQEQTPVNHFFRPAYPVVRPMTTRAALRLVFEFIPKVDLRKKK